MQNFQDLVFEYLTLHGFKELKEKFQVSDFTLARWAGGDSVPHPKLQAQVIDFIRGTLNGT